MNRPNPKLVLAGSIVLSLLIAYWGIAFNKATILVESELDNFKVSIGDDSYQCSSQSCSYKIKPRSYTIEVSKTGYSIEKADVRLDRGDTYTINYKPAKLPEIQSTEQNLEEHSPAQLRSAPSGEQLLWVDLGETLGEQQVTRFPNPLIAPLFSLNPSRTQVLIKSQDQFWLVNTSKQTKSSFEFNTEEIPSRFRFITDNLLVIELNTEYRIYNISTNESTLFPIENISHVIPTSDGNIIVLSKRELDKVDTNQDQNNLLSLLSTTGEDLLKSKPEGNFSLYFYKIQENRYIKVEELTPAKYGITFQLKKSQDNIYLDTNKGQFLLNL